MEFPSLNVEERYHEFSFGPQDARTFAHGLGSADPRTFGEKLLLKRLEPRPPSWTAASEGFEFTCGNGALGVGSLWTRPVLLDPDLALRAGFFSLMLRRSLTGGAAGEQTLVAHLRREPTVGEADDLGERIVPLHAATDAGAQGWEGRYVDLTDLLQARGSGPAYLTLEIHGTCTRTPQRESGVAYGYRALALSLLAGNPANAPEAPFPAVVRTLVPSQGVAPRGEPVAVNPDFMV